MKITPDLFGAFLKCPTKCWLRASGEPTSGNVYAEWVRSQNEAFQATATKRLISEIPKDESVLSPPPQELKAAKWRLAMDVHAQTPETKPGSSRGNEAQTTTSEISQSLTSAPTNDQARPNWIAESRLHVVERVPSEGRGKPAQFIPIRFIFTNKLGKDERLLLGFDAFVLSKMLGREVSLGKIIHGDDHATLTVKTSTLVGEV